MDQVSSLHFVAAFCHILQPDQTVNFTEAKAQYWIQSPKGSDTSTWQWHLKSNKQMILLISLLKVELKETHGDDISVGRLREIKHFNPEFITHPLNKCLFGLIGLTPQPGRTGSGLQEHA